MTRLLSVFLKGKINYKRLPANILGECLRGCVVNGHSVETDIASVQWAEGVWGVFNITLYSLG